MRGPVAPTHHVQRAGLPLLALEIRVVGWLPLALPVVAAGTALGCALTLAVAAQEWDEARRLLVAGLETALPLTAGVAAAVVVTGDRSTELQLSLAMPYRITALRRVALVGVAAASAGLTVTALLTALDLLPGMGAAGAFVLLWAAPLAWFVAAGAAAGLGLGRAGGGALLAEHLLCQPERGEQLAGRAWTRPLWLFVTVQAGHVPDWTRNRIALLLQGAVLVGAAWLLLRRNDRLLQGGNE